MNKVKNLLNAFLIFLIMSLTSMGPDSRFSSPPPTIRYDISTPNPSPKPISRLSTPDRNMAALGRTEIHDLTKDEPAEIPLPEFVTRLDCPILEQFINQPKPSSILPFIAYKSKPTISYMTTVYKSWLFIQTLTRTTKIPKPQNKTNTHNLIDLVLFSFANTNTLDTLVQPKQILKHI